MDASSPARATFLARLGPPFQSTFRPHEALTVQVLAGMVRSVRMLAPDLVVQGGDFVDNDQSNELEDALAALAGGRKSASQSLRLRASAGIPRSFAAPPRQRVSAGDPAR